MGWRRPRHPQHVGGVRALFSLACRSYAPVSSLNVGQRGRTGSTFLGAAFIQSRELERSASHPPRGPQHLYRGPRACPDRAATTRYVRKLSTHVEKHKIMGWASSLPIRARGRDPSLEAAPNSLTLIRYGWCGNDHQV